MFSLSFESASLIAWDIDENRFFTILLCTHAKSSGSIATERFTDSGPFFFGLTIMYCNIPKHINNSITITFLVILKLTTINGGDNYDRRKEKIFRKKKGKKTERA